MMIESQVNIFCILMQTIYNVEQWVNAILMMDLDS